MARLKAQASLSTDESRAADQKKLHELQTALTGATLKIRSLESSGEHAVLSSAAKQSMQNQLSALNQEKDALLKAIEAYERQQRESDLALTSALSLAKKYDSFDHSSAEYVQFLKKSFGGDYLNASRIKTIADCIEHYARAGSSGAALGVAATATAIGLNATAGSSGGGISQYTTTLSEQQMRLTQALGSDQILFSDYVKKYSRTGSELSRVLVLSTRAIYVFDSPPSYVLKRRIPILDLSLVALSKLASHVIVLHHNTQPDLLLSVSKRAEFLFHVIRQYKACSNALGGDGELRIVYGERFYVRSDDHIRRDVRVVHTATKELEFGAPVIVDFNTSFGARSAYPQQDRMTGGFATSGVLHHTGGNALTSTQKSTK